MSAIIVKKTPIPQVSSPTLRLLEIKNRAHLVFIKNYTNSMNLNGSSNEREIRRTQPHTNIHTHTHTFPTAIAIHFGRLQISNFIFLPSSRSLSSKYLHEIAQ